MNETDILVVEQPDQTGDVVSESSEVTDPVQVEVEVLDDYSVENPLPVMLVEEAVEQTNLEVYSVTGSYYGTISDTYLNYFEGIVEKLLPNEHYVVWRSGNYAYTMVYGENVTLEGSVFSGNGTAVDIYRASDSYSSDWYVSTSSQSFDLDASLLFCYSDLGMYPTLERGFDIVESSTLIFVVVLMFLFSVITGIFNCFRR